MCAPVTSVVSSFCDTVGVAICPWDSLTNACFEGAAPEKTLLDCLDIRAMYTVHMHSVLVLHHYVICGFAGEG